MLSEDDLSLAGLSREELDQAWDLWFDLARVTNDADPPYSPSVFAGMELDPEPPENEPPDARRSGPST